MVTDNQGGVSTPQSHVSQDKSQFKMRHPLVVLVWGIGMLIVMNLPNYLGGILGAMMSGLTVQQVISGKEGNLLSHLGQGMTAVIIGIPLAYVAIRYLWRRSIDWMKLRFNWRMAFGGLALGLILPPLILGITSLLTDVVVIADMSRLSLGDGLMIAVSSLCWMTFIGFSEETVFRGMIIREWGSRWGWKAATLLGGLLFAALHLPGVEGGLTLTSVIWILIAGTAVTASFVALYVRARSLWLPIAFHAGWNFCIDGVLGITISGKQPGDSLYQMSVSGQEWLTGGAFGIEASVIAIVVYLLIAYAALRIGVSDRQQLLPSRVA